MKPKEFVGFELNCLVIFIGVATTLLKDAIVTEHVIYSSKSVVNFTLVTNTSLNRYRNQFMR